MYEIGEASWIFRQSYWDSIIILANKELKKNHPNNKKIESIVASSYNNLGVINQNYGNDSIALNYFQKALYYFEKNQDLSNTSAAYTNIGYIYIQQGNIIKALQFWGKSLEIDEKIGDNEGLANTLLNIGSIYEKQGDTSQAMDFYFKAYYLLEKMDDKMGLAYATNNIGILYSNLSYKSKESNNRDSLQNLTILYFEKSLNYATTINNKKMISLVLSNLGNFMYRNALNENKTNIKDSLLEQSLNYQYKALQLREEISEKLGVSNSLISIGQVLYQQNKLSDAKSNGLKSLKIAKELGYPLQIKNSSYLLYDIAKKENNWVEALKMYELAVLYKDSILNSENKKAVLMQQTKYEFEKEQILKIQHEKEILELAEAQKERKNNLQYSIIFIVILVVFALVLNVGYINVSPLFAEGLIFFAFLIFFEFCLVLLDPYIDEWSNGEPIYKLIFNGILASAIFPLHAFFERRLKNRLIKRQ